MKDICLRRNPFSYNRGRQPPKPPGADVRTPSLYNATDFGNGVFPDVPVEGDLCLMCGIVERRRHSWFCRVECDEAYMKARNATMSETNSLVFRKGI